MRVLFSSTWGYGHIFPMVPLARAFVAAGHDVQWATSKDSCNHVTAAGIQSVPAGLSAHELEGVLVHARSAMAGVRPEDKAAYAFPHMFGEAVTPPMLTGLLSFAREWQPHLLVHEHAELAAPLVGDLLGIPSITHAFGGAIPTAILEDAGKRLAPLWSEHGRSIPPYAGCFTSTYLDICPTKVQTVPLSHISTIQPLRPVAYTGSASELPATVSQGMGPLVYVTLGTVKGQALNQVSVLRAVIDSLADLEVRVLVTVGPDGDPDALGPQPAHVVVERFVSQSEVLPHCTAVISHAGSGTVLGALAEGLPQLCLPQAADQFRNSAGVASAGAGLWLHPDDATPAAVGPAIRRILGEDSFRRAAGDVADDIRAMPAPDEVVAELVQLA